MEKKKKILIVILTAFVLLIVGASALYFRLGEKLAPEQLLSGEKQTDDKNEAADGSAEAEKTSAPDFTVYDKEGNEVSLSDYIGKPIVLNFWASWCGPCQMEMPDFHEKYLEIGEEVQFLMVNMTNGSRETLESASAFVEEKGYTFPVFYDTDADAARTYGAYSLPMTYFIDADGNAIAHAVGAIDAETLQSGIDMIY